MMNIHPEPNCIICFENTDLKKCHICSAFLCETCKTWLETNNSNKCVQCQQLFDEIQSFSLNNRHNFDDSDEEHIIYLCCIRRDNNNLSFVQNTYFNMFLFFCVIYTFCVICLQIIFLYFHFA